MSELIVSRESELIIDPEFKNLIPPLTAEEYAGLEESILQDGCRDALIVWNHTLIDGHNRYEICTRHGIPFETTEMFFKDREAAMLWMIQNQQARRNLSKPDSILLAQKKMAIFAKKGREKQLSTLKQNSNDRFINTDKTVSVINVQRETAKEAGVSTGTLAQFEQIQKKAPEKIDLIRTGEISINQAYQQLKLEEKKAAILQAERKIAEQAKEAEKPVLYIGDSIGVELEQRPTLMITDPPYSTDVDDIDDFVRRWLYIALSNVRPSGFAYVFIGAYPDELRAYLNAKIPAYMHLEQVLIWTYKNTLGQNPKERYKQNYQACLFYRGVNAPALNCPLTSEQWAVQEINAPDGRQGDRYHAWQKPLEIAERFIRHSTKDGDLVYDPFACTGTFLLAAAKLGRRAIGYEIDPENAKIAFDRGCVRGVA